MPWDEPGSTAIVVATPEVESLTGAVYRAHSNAGREGMFPHITLLVPFVPAPKIEVGVEARLRAVLKRFQPFNYELVRLARLAEEGVLYFAPEPAAPFVDLITALCAEFPDHPPYDGIHDTIVPHATVAVSGDARFLDQLAAELEPYVPVAARASEVRLVERGGDMKWRLRTTYPLG